MLSVVIPAHNESGYIRPCLDSLLAQTLEGPAWEVIVVANACTDDTVAVCEAYAPRFAARSVGYQVLDIPGGGKTGAMNAGDSAAHGHARAYLDADIVCDPALMAQLAQALDRESPVYASGTMRVPPARSRASTLYAGFWSTLPFMTRGVPGAGLFAVNAAGRARWGAFPDTYSDDTYVRLLFAPAERVAVPASFDWPVVEGFSTLVRNRRRQDAHTRDIHARFPELRGNEDDTGLGAAELGRLILRRPAGFAVYAAVKLLSRLPARGAMRFRGRA
jgi:glycosyltransferase involved in cell wall biosynthesis